MSTVLQRIDSARVSYLTDLLSGIEEKWHSEFDPQMSDLEGLNGCLSLIRS